MTRRLDTRRRFPVRSRLRVIWSVLRGRWLYIDPYLMDGLRDD